MTTNRIATTARIALAAAILLIAAHPSPAQQPAGAKLDLTPVKPESVGFSTERLERLHALMQKEVDQKQFLRHCHPPCPPRQSRRLPRLRRARYSQRRAHDQRHHLPRLLHDQAGHRRGHDDPLRAGQVAPLRPHLQIHSRVRQPQGLQGRRCQWQNDPRRS